MTTAAVTAPRPRALHVQLTGFGPFNGVPVNPTSKLVDQLPAYLIDHPLPPGVHVDAVTTLHVSGTGSLAQLKSIDHACNSSSKQMSEDALAPVRVWLHFGVSGQAIDFNLENQAYNLADFRVPDENAWTPHEMPIDVKAPSTLLTTLHVEALKERLQKKDHKVRISTDPGRFVCNWVYFHSLQRSLDSGAHALFVHVPPEEVMPISDLLRFARDLVACLHELVNDPASNNGVRQV